MSFTASNLSCGRPALDEVAKALDDGVHPVDLRRDLRSGLDRHPAIDLAILEMVLNEADVVCDRRQRLVDLVGYGGCELAGAAEAKDLCNGILIEAELPARRAGVR